MTSRRRAVRRKPAQAKQVGARLLQVLEYMDGPQAVLLERGADSKVVAVAIDRDPAKYPFFGAEISGDQWERYRRGFVDLRFLFMYPKGKRWYYFDLVAQQDGWIPLIEASKTPDAEEHYIPEHGFFAYDHSEPIKEERSKHLATQKYQTDGIWDLPDFTLFY